MRIKKPWIVLLTISICYWLAGMSSFASDSQTRFKAQPAKSIESVEINESISIDIYTPPKESSSTKRFPVMYVMDGQHYFYNAIGYQRSLRNNVNVSPQFMVVGININESTDRWNLLDNDKASMIALLENKVIPLIDTHYPSNKTRMYFGWQAGAAFGLDLFNTRPNLVEGYFFASDPMFDMQRIKDTAATLNSREAFNNYFYMTLGTTETHATKQHQELTQVFSKFQHKGVKWKYNLSENHNHQTTPLDSFTSGLQWYFSDFPDMTFHSVADVNDFGGVSAVKAYFKNRGIRYNLPIKVGKQARFSMFRHAAQEDDWHTFQKFEQAIGPYELTDDASPYWFNFFSKFYAKNDSDRAESAFKKAIRVHPKSHGLYASYAEFKELKGEYRQAKEYYEKALKNANTSEQFIEKYSNKIKVLENQLM